MAGPRDKRVLGDEEELGDEDLDKVVGGVGPMGGIDSWSELVHDYALPIPASDEQGPASDKAGKNRGRKS